MAVGLIAWGRFRRTDAQGNVERVTVPAPPTDPGKPWLADFLREQAATLAGSFDIVQWPPTSKAQGGAGEGCDGYGVFCRRDLGSLPQQGSTPTRYGSCESLLAAVAALASEGTGSYGDLVLHQLIGENGGPGVFEYVGADGETLNGRGRTSPGWFRGGTGNDDPVPPFRPQDSVPVPSADVPFGRELSYQHPVPAGATVADARDFVGWLTRRVGFKGYRFDDTKGTYAPAVRAIMDAEPSLPFYSEYFDGDPGALDWWAQSAPMSGRSAVEDFTLHYRIQAACNGFDATLFDQGGPGYWALNSGLSVGFVDNPDTDTEPGQQVVFNKGIAYAYLLTLPLGLALVYGKDYFSSEVWPGAYGLQPLIDNLCWINRMFAFGACQTVWCDRDVYAMTRDGNGGPVGWSGGLLTALNFNTLTPRTITCQTPFGAHRHLHDYTGHIGDVWTDENGMATFTIPSNYFSGGESYVCLAPAGVWGPYQSRGFAVNQTFVGEQDLDVVPARNGAHALPQRLRVRGGSSVTLTLRVSAAPQAGASAGVEVALLSPTDAQLGAASVRPGQAETLRVHAPQTGWYTVRLTGEGLPAAGVPFELEANYTGAP